MSLLDPTELPRTIITGIIILGLSATFGFIGGCEYKQRAWDKDKLVASEKARALEKTDNSLGHRKMEQLGADKITIDEAQNFVQKELSKRAPLVSCGKLTPVNPIEVKSDEVNPVEIKPTFTAHSMQLYDVSVNPSDVGLRGTAYEAVPEIGIDEGFQIITKNNGIYSEEMSKLARLQQRICEKQKLYEQPISKFCSKD